MSASPPQSRPDGSETEPPEPDDDEGPDRLLGETPLFAAVVGLVLLLAMLGIAALVVAFHERWGW